VDNSWRALVVGPEGIPIIDDAEAASRQPHLAVLSVMAHGRSDDFHAAVAIASAAATGVAKLPEPLRMLCFALIETSLGEAARKTFEMLPQGQRFFSETQRKSFSEGVAQGRAEGVTQGRAEGEALAIVRVLEGRGVPVGFEDRKRILACTDLALLEAWLDRAVTATTAGELFG
jgi:hypothetical protein